MIDMELLLKPLGLPIANTSFLTETMLPFIVHTDYTSIKGSDFHNDLVERDLTIEFYSKKISKKYETDIENLLNENSIKYTKNRIWLETERCFETIYDFTLIERSI